MTDQDKRDEAARKLTALCTDLAESNADHAVQQATKDTKATFAVTITVTRTEKGSIVLRSKAVTKAASTLKDERDDVTISNDEPLPGMEKDGAA